MRDVYSLIRKLGATSKYKGYYFLAEAVKVSMQLEERPIKVTKDIYPILAKRFKSTPSNIEHNIRTLVNLCWHTHREAMEELAGYTMKIRPTNSEFLDILVYYLDHMQQNRLPCPDSFTSVQTESYVYEENQESYHPTAVPDVYPGQRNERLRQ